MERKRKDDGTYAKENYSMYEGKKYGRLTIMKIYRYGSKQKLKCICLCECGNTIDIYLHNLKNKNTLDCGCNQKNELYDEMIGKRFGKLTVIEGLPHKEVYNAKYRCICDCGNYVNVSRANLLQGTKSCGCIHRISTYNDTLSKSNTSGIKGVHYDKASGKWMAKLTIQGKVYKKRFWKIEDATKYRKDLEDKYHKIKKEEYEKYKRKKKK